MATGLVWHELYMWHDTGTAAWVMPPGLTVEPFRHIESPEGKRRLRNLVEVSGLLDHLVQLRPRPATETERSVYERANSPSVRLPVTSRGRSRAATFPDVSVAMTRIR